MSEDTTGGEPVPGRRRRASLASVVVASIVVAAGGAAVALRLGGHATPPHRRAASPSQSAECPAAQTASPTTPPLRLGGWKFSLLERGTFAAIAPAPAARPGSVVALQACGPEETALRVVELERGKSPVVSAQYRRAAPIASSVLDTATAVWFGEGRLALHGRADAAPYRLTLHELDPSNLSERRTISVGRGYGLSLIEGPGNSVLASTGRALIRVANSGAPRTIATFPGVVVQHVAPVDGSELALVSVFTPSAAPPASSTAVELVDLTTGRIAAKLDLPQGAEVESLAVDGTTALAAVGEGGSTSVERLALGHAIGRRAVPHRSVPTTLTPLQIVALGSGPALVYGPTTLACVAPQSGSVLGSTTPEGPAELVSGLAGSVSRAVAIVPAGLGTVNLPDACR